VFSVKSLKWIIQRFWRSPSIYWRWRTGLKASSVDETDVWEETSDETESDPASVERDRWRKRKIVMPSESPLAKTRPGLRISWRKHTVAIIQLRRRIYRRLFARCIAKTRPRPRFSLRNYLLNREKFSNYYRSRNECSHDIAILFLSINNDLLLLRSNAAWNKALSDIAGLSFFFPFHNVTQIFFWSIWSLLNAFTFSNKTDL